MTRYRCVDAQKAAGFAATAACEAVEVSTTAYYQWVAGETHEPGDKERADAALLAEIRDIHAHMDETYGSPRMKFELTRRGWQANEKRVARLMREHGLVGYRPVKRASTTQRDTGEPPMPDLVGRHFDPAWPGHVWCGDLTYVPTGEGWLYVATVIDLASRRLIGWSMSDTPDAQLMIAALDHAVAERGVARMNGVIFHHDRGTQYMSAAFAQACWRLGVTQSASRTGSCLDNAVAESFFATLKVELVNRCRYQTRREARTSIFRWIARYNDRRLHSTLNYLPPTEWEQAHSCRAPVRMST
ncbi:IS3 family transposase [Egibacter rhizosphaerae]|uniref:IS3 family transposase n=1 Tax=Egibacter rhizosphaerae TaxID=1670831 RepID=UPI0013F1464D|nr:IS3 family transposase [Egibacter rhizosphaerae]